MPTETPPPSLSQSQSKSSAGSPGSVSVCEKTSRPKTPPSVPPQDNVPNPASNHHHHQQQQQQQQSQSTSQTQQQQSLSPPASSNAAGSNSGAGGGSSGPQQTGTAQQFCLRWNNYQTNLTSVFDQLLQNESFVDVTLACDGQSIKAHKMVLSACSPYFQALFFDNPCQHPIIIMRDVKWPELKAAVEFMYKGEINVSQDQIGPLLRVAEMLKIRGLADVNGEPEMNAATTSHTTQSTTTSSSMSAGEVAAKKSRVSREWELSSNVDASAGRNRKRRWPSAENATSSDSPGPSAHCGGGNGGASGRETAGGGGSGLGGASTPDNTSEMSSPVAAAAAAAATNPSQMSHQPSTPNTLPSFPIPTPLECMGLPAVGMSHADDMEIKPGIAEMIREEERAKLMENSHAWLGAPTSSIAGTSANDSYQYQLQSMWQKCWNTNQNLMHHLRFRERGPLKSWRPETMAEAIFSVLKEGLSLSQAARKYDIPYPTFVLYANRVHNMLGPSIDGGTDLRPKGRGRPQRILLGIWPDDHIKGVIKTVVFRDAKELKDEGMHLQYGRHSPVFPFQDGALNYPGNPCTNGLPQPPSSVADSMSPEATAAAVAAVAHGLRQQMQMAVAAQHHTDATSNLFNLPAHMHSSNGGVSLPKQNSPASSGQSSGNLQRHASPSLPGLPNPASLGISGIPGLHIIPGLSSSSASHASQSSVPTSSAGSYSSNVSSLQQQQQTSASSSTHLTSITTSSSSLNLSRLESPSDSAHDLRMNSPDESPLNSPMEMSALEPAVNLAVGVSGMAYKPSRGYSSPRPEHLFQEDIADLVGTRNNCPPNMSSFKEPSSGIKIEPMAECRSE